MLVAFLGLSPIEVLIVGVVAVLLFGSRLPSVARSAGKSLTEFRRGMDDLQHEFRDAMRETERAATPTAPQLTAVDPHAHGDDADRDGDAIDGAVDDRLGKQGDAADDVDPALAGGYPETTKSPFAD